MSVMDKTLLPPPDHVGILTKDADKAAETFSALFGLGPWNTFDLTIERDYVSGGPVSFHVNHAQLGNVVLEVIEQREGKGMWGDFIEATGGGLHHLCYSGISNYDEVLASFDAQGCQLVARFGGEPKEVDGKMTLVDSPNGMRASFYKIEGVPTVVELVSHRGLAGMYA